MILPVEVLVLEEMIVLEDKVVLEEAVVLGDTAVLKDTVVLDDDIVLLVADVTGPGPDVELLVLVLIVEDDVGFTAHDD